MGPLSGFDNICSEILNFGYPCVSQSISITFHLHIRCLLNTVIIWASCGWLVALVDVGVGMGVGGDRVVVAAEG